MLFGGDSIWLSGGNLFRIPNLGAIPVAEINSTKKAAVPQARDLPP
jgi:hypothetical protein